MLVVLAVYAAGVYVFISRSLSESLDQQLQDDFWWAAAMVDQEPDGTITSSADESGSEEQPLWLQVWSLDGQLLYRNIQAQLNPVPGSQALVAQGVDGVVSVPSTNVVVRILTRPREAIGRNLGRSGAIRTRPVVIQVARSETPMRQELRELLLILVFGLPVGAAIAGLGGYVLARRALTPVERMAERAQLITADRLSDRLPVGNPRDELGRLATVFNQTLERLEASFEQMRRFTADVSHELRTPLTAIRSVGEVGLRERRDDEAYRGIIGSMLEEVDRLSGLVDRLLTLSRAETGQTRLSVEAIDLGELAANVAGHLGVLAEEKDQSIEIDAAGSPKGLGDRLMVRQALINLVDNAIKYTPAGGRIRIRGFESPSGDAVLEVSDSGPGIAAGHSAQVFDRFYQQGGSEPGGGSGVGLGLAIAKWAVEMNGGQLSLEQGNGAGCTFRMTLPAVAHPAGAKRV
jgi:heavy metal sensor kinase